MWGSVEMHRSFPFLRLLQPSIGRIVLVVPDDDDFFDWRAVHGGISVQVFPDDSIVLPGIVGGRDQPEPE